MGQERCCVGFETAYKCGAVLPPSQPDPEELATVLSEALYDEPQFEYVCPDKRSRHRFLHSFFGNAIQASHLSGEIHATQGVDGGALWIGPATALTMAGVMRPSPPPPEPWGWANIRRYLNVAVHLDRIHRQLVIGQHWYLVALGVKPSSQRQHVASLLLEPLLTRAETEGLPCYLEAFNGKDLLFYERHGFRIAGGGKIPKGGPDFWVMIRRSGSGRSGPGYSNPEFCGSNSGFE
jgi:ribosomal protein S18 acetylase RimI-like enzyme